MARKSKGGKRKAKVEITAKDFRFPGESGVYWTGVGGIAILFVWLCIMGFFFTTDKAQRHMWQWIYLFLWPIASILLANLFSARPRKEQLKKAGRGAKVMPQNNPELYALVQDQSRILGLAKQPDLFLVDDNMAYIFSLPGKPGSVIASKPTQQALSRDEFGVLLARELGLHKAHNVRLSMAITWVQTSNIGVKIGLLPLYLMSVFMRGWADLSEFTADRAGLLVVGSEGIVNLALVKLLIAQDPQAEINHDDLEAFLQGGTGISADFAQLERHYRIGTFIDQQRNLKERIDQMAEYRKSDQGRQAFEKVAEIRGVA